ncbi:AAA family ATPase [Bacillus mesophilum]|uniref:AAA family ATPase n=1 Tax=Bacillus mesophilum TaxID=1071718 RepID=A0A7V7RNG6_9BACI|nr:AAA family ATPase [Bacillus mesophilum]
MRITKFSVTNYKVFSEKFTIDFSADSIAILTGRNNTGKSTILEAINCFFVKDTKTNTIASDCFSDTNNEIILEAEFLSGEESHTFFKKYQAGSLPKYYGTDTKEIKAKHPEKDIFDEIINNKPYYITPAMTTEDINQLIQTMYSQIIKSKLEKIELEIADEDPDYEIMKREYDQIRKAYPIFLKKLKKSIDLVLDKVSNDVSGDLRKLFSNDELALEVLGGESDGFSASDLVKSTSSSIVIDSNRQKQMPLANQGTGLQRMSLIYLIQNMIQNKLLGNTEEKLLLIDEPEAFLHPEAVRALSRSLYEIGARMPLMISTHSPVLIDLAEKHTSIQVFRVGENKAIQLYKSATTQFDDNDIKNMKILNYVDSYINEFFFADKIVIVEGDTEYIAFKHFFKEKNVNIHIIRARGKATICTLMKILNQFNTNYDVIHDVDNNYKFSSKTLQAQLTNCKNILKLKISNNIRIFSSVSNFEEAIGIGEIENSKKTQTIYNILNEVATSGVYKEARKKVENLFDIITNQKEINQLDDGFKGITSEQDYEDFFIGLIAEKKKEEREQQEQVNNEENVK